MDVTKWLEDQTILKVYRGSHAYGTNTETSDIDIGGVCIPPIDYIIGCYSFEQYESKNYINFPTYNKSKKVADAVIYSLNKFINLAIGCNPNIIEYLFTDRTHIIKCTPEGQMLIDNRNIFLSKKARHTFGGYAFAQLKRLTNKLPMEEAKKRLENLNQKINQLEIHLAKQNHELDIYNNQKIWDDNDAIYVLGIKTDIKNTNEIIGKHKNEIIEIEKAMGGGNHNHHGSHKELIDMYGFDSKHAMHLIRLLHMGLEILTTGECYVLRPDNNYLMAIRNGEYTLEYIQKEAERLFKLLDDALVKSKLPNSPDIKKVNKLLIDLTWESIQKER